MTNWASNDGLTFVTEQPPENLYVSIIAGGVGTRLWPKSRRSSPKQFLQIGPGASLIQRTYHRIAPLTSPDRIFVICLSEQREAVLQQLPDLPAENVIGEPRGRNTAMAIGLAASAIAARDDEAAMISVGSDHFVGDEDAFRRTLLGAAAAARSGDYLVTVGIDATEANTGYGYIRRGEQAGNFRGIDVFRVKEFREKPDSATAEAYFASGEYSWNSNYFAWSVKSIISAFAKHAPEIGESLIRIRAAVGTSDIQAAIEAEYRNAESVAIDAKILELSDNVLTVPGNFPWADIGSWSGAYAAASPEGENFRTGELSGRVIFENSRGCLVDSRGRLVAIVGLENTVVIDTADALLVCSRENSEMVGRLVERLSEEGFPELL